MANLPQNDKYAATSQFPSKPSASQVRNIPKAAPATPVQTPTPAAARAPVASNPFGGSSAAVSPQQWSTLRDTIAPEVNAPIDQGFQQRYGAIPQDYVGFEEPGGYYDPVTGETTQRWETPSDQAVVSNLPGIGQYILDKKNPSGMVKSQRPSLTTTREERALLLRGLPPSQFQVDHIIPLWAGGSDTLANKQVIAKDRHQVKTDVQAVAFTLMAHGLIDITKARSMALTWEQKDAVDIPHANDSGMIPLESAEAIRDRWSRQSNSAPSTSLKDVLSSVPEGSKDMGKGIIPDWIRAPMKGLVTGFTGGMVPAAQDDDASTIEKVLYMGGVIGGALVPIGWLAKGVGMTMRGISVLRGASKLAATEKGFLGTARGLSRLDKEADLIAKVGKKGLNSKPSVLDAVNWRNVGKFSAGSAAYGQLGAEGAIGGTIADQMPEEYQNAIPEERAAARFWEDMALGAITGAASPTLKGASLVASTGFIWSYTANPDLSDALTNAGVFAALHGSQIPGARRNLAAAQGRNTLTQINKKTGATEPFAPKAPMKGLIGDPARLMNLEQQIDDHGTRAANNLLVEMAGGEKAAGRPLLKEGDTVPPQQDISYESAADLTLKAKAKNQAALSTGEISFPEYAANTKRIVASGRQMYKRGLPMAMRKQADIEDLLSIAKKAKEDVAAGVDQRTDPNIIPTTTHDIPETLQSVDDSLFKNSLAAHNSDIPSGKYPIGRVRVSGMANEHPDKKALQAFIQDMPKGEVAPFVVLAERADLESTWKDLEKSYTPEELTKKTKKNFSHPENAVQVIGYRKTADGGWKAEHLGWLPREHHILSESEGGSPYSFHSVYDKYGLPQYKGDPKLNKDLWAPAMRKEGLKFLVANVDRNRTGYASELSDNPFMHITVNDENWNLSKRLSDALGARGSHQKGSTQEAISTVKNAINAKQQQQAITEIRGRVKDPADVVLDTTPLNIAIEDSPVQGITSVFFKNIRSAFEESADPQSLKQSVQKWLGVTLDDVQAAEVFAMKDEMSVQDALKVVTNAMKGKQTDGKIDVLYKNFVVPFFESPAYKNWQYSKAFPKMRLMGGVKTEAPVQPGQPVMDTPVTSATEEVLPPVEAFSEVPQEASLAGSSMAPEAPISPSMAPEASQMPGNVAPTPRPDLATQMAARSGSSMIDSRVTALVDEGKAQMDALLMNQGDRYQRNSSAKRYESVINSIKLDPKGLTRQQYDEINSRIKDELSGYAEQKLAIGDVGGQPETGSKPIKVEETGVAGVGAADFVKNIREGATSDNAYRRSSSHAYDTILTHVFGKGYENNPEFQKWFGSDTPQGQFFWNKVFGRSQSEAGLDYSQPEGLVKAVAKGDRTGYFKQIDERKAKLAQHTQSENVRKDNVDPAAEQQTGQMLLEKGMHVESDVQNEGQARDLTYGEAMFMPNAAGFGEETAVAAVRDLKNLFTDKQGLIAQINKERAATGTGKKVSLPGTIFTKLMAQAEKFDSIHSKAVVELETVKKQLASLSKALETAPDSNLEAAFEDLQSRYVELSKIVSKSSESSPTTQ